MKIAITGTIGSGKSETSNYLRSLGCCVFDCDAVNRQLLKERAYELLKEDFPECFIGKELDKKKLTQTVFSDPERKERLESIMHPEILKEMLKIETDPLFAEVPLLFESGWDVYFDRKILIVADEETALERLVDRGLEKEDAMARLQSQMPVSEKMKRADKIIYNNGSLQDLYAQIDEALKEILC